MNVLVAYASKRGSTAEIAEAIAETLWQSGLSVDCIEAGKVSSVESYDGVVLGSAVYIKRWRGDAKHFLRKHDKELSQRPFWVFSSGPVGDPNSEADPSWLEPPNIIERVVRLKAREHVVFGGRIPVNPRGPMEHATVKNTPPEYHDRRDWDEIRAWAAGIASELGAATKVMGRFPGESSCLLLVVERAGVGLPVLDSVEVLAIDVGEGGAVAGVAEEQVEHRPEEVTAA